MTLPFIRKTLQGLAVLGGSILILHGILLMTTLTLSPLLTFLTGFEIVLGVITIAVDTWFFMFT